jgi:hypothetical protein
MLPKTFTNETLDTVAGYRGLNMFPRNRHAESRKTVRVILPEYDKIFITDPPGRSEYSLEFITLGQTLASGKTPAGYRSLKVRADG